MMKKITAVIFVLCFLIQIILPVDTVQAANVSKKTITITINKKNPNGSCAYELKNDKVKLNVSVKILSISGKAKEASIPVWGWYSGNMAKGSLFCGLQTSNLKKNKILTSTEFRDFPMKSGGITFHLPDGIKSMKLKVTISSVNGKKTIKSFKKTKKIFG